MNSPHLHLDVTRLAASQQRQKPSPLFACPEPGCTRVFYRRCTLSEHLVTHTGEKPYVCRIQSCGKRFSTSGNLSRHKHLHGPIVPLKCPMEECSCSFLSEAKLENHMKYHFGTSVHMCLFDGCGNTYSTIGNLKRHLRIHHDAQYQPQANVLTPTNSSPKKTASSPTTMDEFAFDANDNEAEFNDSDAWLAARMAATEPSVRDETSQPWEPEIFEALLSMLDGNDVTMHAV
uniref:C2H2-type domain-containing protein n=1 Tax=Globisporangium ultimum (strain ATCC 200006 / CBS 805.95 / DAOM BR144) TaxID=431595 RepID=K3WNX5_GLOUD